MSRLVMVVLVLFSLVLFLGCGNGSSSCESDSDCVGTERCLWVKQGGQVIGKRCSLLCSLNDECPDGEQCNGGAASCPSCNDFQRICEPNP